MAGAEPGVSTREGAVNIPPMVGLFSIFAPVTASSAICDVSILPSTNSELSTESGARSPANIVASTIFAAVMLLSGMSALVKAADAPLRPR